MIYNNCFRNYHFYYRMQITRKPPVAHRKKLTIVQPPKTLLQIPSGQEYDSGMASVRSLSRTRGVSMSRSSGLTIDKIYDKKHFPNIPTGKQQTKDKPKDNTLSNCRSLKLVSLQATQSINSDYQQFTSVDPSVQTSQCKPGSPIPKMQLQTESRASRALKGPQSIINKLQFDQPRKTAKQKDLKLLPF